MALTRPDIIIPKGVWTNLYTASGIAVGTAVNIYNKSIFPCMLYVKETAPVQNNSGGIPLYGGGTSGSFAYVSAGEVGLWAYADAGATLLIQE